MADFTETPLMEITLRRYESPHHLSQRDTLKKICLSLGLLQPGDTRDIIVDILLVLEREKPKRRVMSAIDIKEELVECRKKHGLSLNGTADSNIRRQLKRLREVFLVEKVRNNYRIVEYMSLAELFENKIQKIILDAILARNKDYFEYYKNFEPDINKIKEDPYNQEAPEYRVANNNQNNNFQNSNNNSNNNANYNNSQNN